MGNAVNRVRVQKLCVVHTCGKQRKNPNQWFGSAVHANVGNILIEGDGLG